MVKNFQIFPVPACQLSCDIIGLLYNIFSLHTWVQEANLYYTQAAKRNLCAPLMQVYRKPSCSTPAVKVNLPVPLMRLKETFVLHSSRFIVNRPVPLLRVK